jgi:hypothetical protein
VCMCVCMYVCVSSLNRICMHGLHVGLSICVNEGLHIIIYVWEVQLLASAGSMAWHCDNRSSRMPRWVIYAKENRVHDFLHVHLYLWQSRSLWLSNMLSMLGFTTSLVQRIDRCLYLTPYTRSPRTRTCSLQFTISVTTCTGSTSVWRGVGVEATLKQQLLVQHNLQDFYEYCYVSSRMLTSAHT